MKIKAVGCHGGISPGYRTTCYEVEKQFLIDCGAGASGFSLEEQAEITDIFITHPHLDHIKDIAFVIENTFSSQRKPLNLRSSEAIINDVHTHLFNNVIWPDFSKIISNGDTGECILKFKPFDKTVTLGDFKISSIEVNHPGNALGFIIDNNKEQVLFSGDTGPTDELWQKANQCENLKAIFTEISFPNNMKALAEASGHYTLSNLVTDMNKVVKKDIPIYISHLKPLFLQELLDEFHTYSSDRFHLLHQDEIIEV